MIWNKPLERNVINKNTGIKHTRRRTQFKPEHQWRDHLLTHKLLVIHWCGGLQVQNKVFHCTCNVVLFWAKNRELEVKSRCFEPAGHVLHAASLPLHLLPCWFSPSAEQQGRFSRRNREPRQKVRICHPVKSEFCGSSVFILFYSAILTVLRVPKRGALCTGDIWSRGSAQGRRKRLGLEGVRKKKCPPPLFSASTFCGSVLQCCRWKARWESAQGN